MAAVSQVATTTTTTPTTITPTTTTSTTATSTTTTPETKTTTTTTPTTTATTTTTTITTTTAFPRCNKAAHYDADKNHCVCNDPKKDGVIRDPKKYRNYTKGDVCYVCSNSYTTKAIVFILDNSGTVGTAGWDAQKKFMVQLLDTMENVTAGVVVINDASYVAVPMDSYKNNKKKIEDFVKNTKFRGSYTTVGVALYHARMMLEKVVADEKRIVIYSDGDFDRCHRCEKWKKDNMTAHPQDQEAEEIHKLGINVTFVAVKGYQYDNKSDERIKKIAGSNGTIISIRNFADFDESVLNGVINTVCTVEM